MNASAAYHRFMKRRVDQMGRPLPYDCEITMKDYFVTLAQVSAVLFLSLLHIWLIVVFVVSKYYPLAAFTLASFIATIVKAHDITNWIKWKLS